MDIGIPPFWSSLLDLFISRLKIAPGTSRKTVTKGLLGALYLWKATLKELTVLG